MRKLISAGITAFALGGALLAGGSPATAAPAASAVQQVVPPAASAVQKIVPQTQVGQHEYYDWYWSRSACNEAGAKMLVRGIIYGYSCDLSPYLTWYLYVDY
ncbi:hypothetical protein [Amycolatopsis sp. NPDC052450]|uniref:hypothetical protein n=1 Tax=Amycolatopsis sp. NPDC052450 TaxID=3363937 RepID=UPI0037C8BCA6